jgi:hypothetical protein
MAGSCRTACVLWLVLTMVACGSPSADPPATTRSTDKPAATVDLTTPDTPPARTDTAADGIMPEVDPQPQPDAMPDVTSTPKTLDDEAFAAAMAEVDALRDRAQFREAVTRLRELRAGAQLTADQMRQFNEVQYQARYEMQESQRLQFAFTALGAPEAERQLHARQQFLQAGDVGRAMLRQGVQTGNTAAVLNSLRLLADLREPKLGSIVAAKLAEKDLDVAVKQVCLEVLAKVPADATRANLQLALDLVRGAEHPAEPMVYTAADLLVAVFSEVAQRQSERFDEKLGRAGAYETLRTFAGDAMVASDERAVQWGRAHTDALQLYLIGLHGRYYHGTGFDELVFERLDGEINRPGLEYNAFPSGRDTNISARWSGFILVPTAGEYTFYGVSDDGQRLWVNEEQVIDNWQMQSPTEHSGKITLEAGLVPIRLEWNQGGGGAHLVLSWEGPGFERTVIPAEAFRTPPHEALMSAKPSP